MYLELGSQELFDRPVDLYCTTVVDCFTIPSKSSVNERLANKRFTYPWPELWSCYENLK